MRKDTLVYVLVLDLIKRGNISALKEMLQRASLPFLLKYSLPSHFIQCFLNISVLILAILAIKMLQPRCGGSKPGGREADCFKSTSCD